ncbi:MAG: 30S ribosomal protein S4 [Lentisphaeria bacterium]|nr:30S ribosomal protein S4 [Lentisphaeria bacterium]
MARFTGPKGKIVRRFGENIFGQPKFDRLLAKKPHGPGFHGPNQGRRKLSEYGKQLVEKQKLKYAYGLLERQFRITFNRARRMQGITGDNLLVLLESRFDNVIYRAGIAGSRDQARQLILHGHLKVNGRRVNVPSYQISENDVITVKDSVRSQTLVRRYLEENASRPAVDWLAVSKDELSVQVIRQPLREEIQSVANEQVVVELYSK